jgi:hypothetical protein
MRRRIFLNTQYSVEAPQSFWSDRNLYPRNHSRRVLAVDDGRAKAIPVGDRPGYRQIRTYFADIYSSFTI